MTVAPVQDLIVDVMAAADPVSQRRRRGQTRAPGIGGGPELRCSGGSEDEAQPGWNEARRPRRTEACQAAARSIDSTGHAPIIRGTSSNSDVYRKFEAFILQMFVESMLPKDATKVFGKGTAGTVWRSMLAEQIGNEMAKGNGIGIAKQLAKSRAATDPAEI